MPFDRSDTVDTLATEQCNPSVSLPLHQASSNNSVMEMFLSLQSTVKGLQSTVKGLQSTIYEQNESHEARMSNFEAGNSALKAKNAELEAEVKGLKARVHALEVDKRMLVKEGQSVFKRVRVLESRAVVKDTAFQVLCDNQGVLSARHTVMQSTASRLQQNLSRQDATLVANGITIGSLQEYVQRQWEQVGGLTAELASMWDRWNGAVAEEARDAANRDGATQLLITKLLGCLGDHVGIPVSTTLQTDTPIPVQQTLADDSLEHLSTLFLEIADRILQ
ncbi:hypothetical protein BDR26DRAFT_1004852 [Obelidium mucronatum]|nr:hypothetical protein BDR26DRAFT_1004852 [Obelidium mucronatum]